MCLGVPGKVVEWLDRDPLIGRALVEFGGIRRECQMACVPEASEGDYVIVHAGVAISRVDTEEAQRVFHLLKKLEDSYDPTDKLAALRVLHEASRRGEFATGLIYIEPDRDDFLRLLNVVDEPLARLPLERIRPPKAALDEIMESLR